MSQTLRTLGLAALIAASASAFMTTNASALSSHDCSVMWHAAQAAKTDGGMSYKDYRTANCSAAAAAPAAPAAPAAKMTKATAPAAPAVAKVAAPTAPAVAAAAVTPSGSFLKDCSATFTAMKAAKTVPAGMTWKDFVAAKCVVAGAAAPAAPAAKGAAAAAPAAPAAPMVKMTKVAAPTEPTAADAPVKTVDKNGKPFTAGQIAFYQHEKICGAEWRGLATKPVGMKWPQYLSACHKKLKAAGK